MNFLTRVFEVSTGTYTSPNSAVNTSLNPASSTFSASLASLGQNSPLSITNLITDFTGKTPTYQAQTLNPLNALLSKNPSLAKNPLFNGGLIVSAQAYKAQAALSNSQSMLMKTIAEVASVVKL